MEDGTLTRAKKLLKCTRHLDADFGSDTCQLGVFVCILCFYVHKYGSSGG